MQTTALAAALEVHEHLFIRGRRAAYAGLSESRVVHSHEGGDVPHQHCDTGPASYTIDKDDWFRRTGLKGGGRKKFTAKPTGEQFPIVDLEGWQKSFEIIVCAPSKEFVGTGPGIALPERMRLGFGMTVSVVRDGGGVAS